MNIKFPEHKGTMTLIHNPHKDCYLTAEQYVRDYSFTPEDFVSEEEMQKAIETDEIWELCWYPDTPVRACTLASSSMESLFESLNKE